MPGLEPGSPLWFVKEGKREKKEKMQRNSIHPHPNWQSYFLLFHPLLNIFYRLENIQIQSTGET